MIYVHVMLCDSSVLENDFEIMMQLVEEGKRTFCFNSWVVTQVIYRIKLSGRMLHKFVNSNLRQLESEIQESKTTSASIKVLLLNMLPAHVVNMLWKVDAYLKHRVSHEPYYEYHRYVAVMFATVLPDESITMDLSLMNDIICNFDDVLSMYRSPLKVEKIKIVNGTYMAACGLSVDSTGRSSVFLSTKKGLVDIRSHRFLRRIANADIHNFGILGRSTSVSERSEDSDNASWISEQWDTDSDDKKQTVVYRMASFALDLLKTVQKLNARLKEQRGLKNTPLSLRVGISSGEVAAGIVGYTTSHYDIWGNAVNMASRMDSTGVSNRIQVCEQTANILAAYDIVCSYRGMTYIKSLGELPTYFIEIDKLLNFIYKNEENGV
uniref:adenylate cyclase n=1 Tax=Glossina pallidipes TaxID=7398 RepID=A0A1A9ZAQ3_GLOPL